MSSLRTLTTSRRRYLKARLRLIDKLFYARKYGKAISAIDRLIKEFPSKHFLVGMKINFMACLGSCHYSRAMRLFRKIVSIGEPLIEQHEHEARFVLPWIAESWGTLGYLDKALAFSERAVHLEPKNEDNWFRKARWLTGLGRCAAALKALSRAIELSRRNNPKKVFLSKLPSLYSLKAILLARLGKLPEASITAKEAMAMKSVNEETLWELRNTLAAIEPSARGRRKNTLC